MIQNSYIGRYEQMNNKIILLEKDIIAFGVYAVGYKFK